MDFALTILGVSGATPGHGRFPTSQVLQVHQHVFLIDCGEGAQMRLSDYNIPRNKINQVFISHLHGDHFFGLPGLLFSYSLNDRNNPLEIFSPPGLEPIMRAQLLPGGKLSYPIYFREFDPSTPQIILENDELIVHTIPLKHRIPTAGFLFREKPFQPNIRKDKILEYNMTVQQIKAVKSGEDLLLEDGTVVPHETLTHPPYATRSYAYVSDTQYDESIVPLIRDTDLLYHEATFGKEMEENAKKTMHTTAEGAAMIARKANAGRLVIGHYSSRYADIAPLLKEAKAVFPDTLAGTEGITYEVERKRMQM